jgi:TolB-like protein
MMIPYGLGTGTSFLSQSAGKLYRVARSGGPPVPFNGQTIDSLAVLPFTNVGGSPDADYLSDGIIEV